MVRIILGNLRKIRGKGKVGSNGIMAKVMMDNGLIIWNMVADYGKILKIGQSLIISDSGVTAKFKDLEY